MLEHIEPGVFGLTPFTGSLAEPIIANSVDCYIDLSGPLNLNLPAFVASTNYENPTDAASSNFTHRFGQPVWEWLKTHPKQEATLGGVMAAYAVNRPDLSQIYPSEQLLNQVGDDEGILFVDIGGGQGHGSTAFAKAHPQKSSRIVLQDRPEALRNAPPLDAAIQKMEYDFFTPQPVENAAAYYL